MACIKSLALRPLLFVIVIEVKSRKFRDAFPKDDPHVIADKLIRKLNRWKDGMVSKTSWRSSNIIGHINEITLRRAQLVLGWVTVSVFHQATQANSVSYPQWDGK